MAACVMALQLWVFAAPVLVLVVLGAVFGVGLAVASKVFAVVEDERVERVLEVLPSTNCGSCGFGGCHAYAKSLAAGRVASNLCRPGGREVAQKLAEILGVEALAVTPKASVLFCQGKRVAERFKYVGISDCNAAALVQGGFKACEYGCIGLGTCVEACPFDAIEWDEEGFPRVDSEKCTACGVCVRACPKHLYEVQANEKSVHILCRNKDKGAVAKQKCEFACIACQRCVKACPVNAISVVDFLARIDYEKCKVCGECIAVCPTHAVVNLLKEPVPVEG